MKLIQKSLLSTLLLAGIISNANAASVTYDYVGNNFIFFQTYDPISNVSFETNTLPSKVGPRMTGSATFADGIDNSVTSYMLTDGLNTIDNTMADGAGFEMTFNNNNVDTWYISLVNNEGVLGSDFNSTQLFTQFQGFVIDYSYFQAQENGAFLILDFASITNQGAWTLRQEQVSEVPVPAALPLMASALGLFGFAKRRKQSV